MKDKQKIVVYKDIFEKITYISAAYRFFLGFLLIAQALVQVDDGKNQWV